MCLVRKRLTIPSSLKHIKPTVHTILGILRKNGVDESVVFDIRLSVEEALINAIRHGNRLDERLSVHVDFSYEGDTVSLTIEDMGEGFDYHTLPNPTHEDNVLKTMGRGIFLVRHLMDRVEFNEKGNRITMIKKTEKQRNPAAQRGEKHADYRAKE